MIGIVSNETQKPIIQEFFELFKTPWEFYREGEHYDVVLVSEKIAENPPAKVAIIFGTDTTIFDVQNHLQLSRHGGTLLLEHEGSRFPVYTGVSSFNSANNSSPADTVIKTMGKGESVGILASSSEMKILRIGYDLFGEVEFLLTNGQPIEFAQIPTLERHISVLRKCMVASGIIVVEVPPVPYGHSFITCLTHDVDFLELRNHGFDRSLAGFIGRSLMPVHYRGHQPEVAVAKCCKNLLAVLSIPAVYMGLCRDIWFDIDKYLEIEGDAPSTFYFIPFKNDPGQHLPGYPAPHYRAARYELSVYRNLIADLLSKGREVGVHGLDAWQDSQKGLRELAAVQKVTGQEQLGIRMHWLYFSDESPKALSDAGFLYDSSVGYNETLGFRAGTAQVFHRPGVPSIPELPLIIMDTTLFYPDRMGLTEQKALGVCADIISEMRRYGGALTINWHTRSLSPERNWNDIYFELLATIKTKHACFLTARQAVDWFKQRRALKVDSVDISSKTVRVTLSSDGGTFHLAPCVRIHLPPKKSEASANRSPCIPTCIDVPWQGEATVHASI
jgi:hypothetical protein